MTGMQLTPPAAYGQEAVLYNAVDGLRNWRKAKAAQELYLAGLSAGAVMNIGFIGGSNEEGYAGADITLANYEWGVAKRVRAAIQAKYGDTGAGFMPGRYPVGAASPAWVQAGTWYNYGPVVGWAYFSNGAGILTSNVIGSILTANFDGAGHFNGTGLTILVEEHSAGGDFTVAIDGGAAVTYTNYAATSGVKAINITGLSDADHTCVITAGSAILSVLGGYEIKGTRGFRVNTLAAAGGHIAGIAHAEVNLKAVFDHWTPVLSIMTFIGNDYNMQTPLSSFIADWQAAITRAKTFGDVMVTSMGGFWGDNDKTIPISAYKNAVRDLAIGNGCAYLDISRAIGGSYAVANAAGYMADAVHYSAAGHQAAADLILQALEIST